MDALALGVLTRKGASGGHRGKKGKDKKKEKGKGKAEAVEEEMAQTEGDVHIVLGDSKGADVAELAALEAAWTGYMRRMEGADADQGEWAGCTCSVYHGEFEC